MLTLGGDGTVPLFQSSSNEMNAEISPDGRWLAYQSNESGEYQIHVRPFPNASTGQWQVTTDGGTRPLWSPAGDELFYLSPEGALMSVRVERTASWTAGAPAQILAGQYFYGTGAAGQATGAVGRTYPTSRETASGS